MTTVALFSSLRSRRSPSSEAFLVPSDFSDSALLLAIETLATEIVSSYYKKRFKYQRLNSTLLVGKIQIFLVVIKFIRASSTSLPSSAVLCFKELYLILCRSKMLLEHCSLCRTAWLLLQNSSISCHFHDLNQDVSTLLDVLPSQQLNLSEELQEQVILLKIQSASSKFFFLDPQDESLRLKFYRFLDELHKDRTPDAAELGVFILEELGFLDARACREEVEFLEEQILNNEGEIEPPACVVGGVIALIRYSRFLLFGFEQDEAELLIEKSKNKVLLPDPPIVIPKDFCCPISLDLMRDPVMICTGQTYDRNSICRWIEEGHSTCPKTGQLLVHTNLVPNRALKNLILQWCSSNNYPLDPPPESSPDSSPASAPSKSAMKANRETTLLLINNLCCEEHLASQAIAARELRLLAKTGTENRAFIAEAGAIPHLKTLLTCRNSVAQENSVTALLNLSIYGENKCRIMEEEGCLRAIAYVLRHGETMEARGNAAAALFSLSSVHCYKKTIAGEEGVVEGLVELLRRGSGRGKKDAATALFNLSTHGENCRAMVDAGAVHALVGALVLDVVSEEVAGVLAMVLRRPEGLDAVVKEEEEAVSGLIGAMRCGSPRGKEHAVAALLELCRGGGVATTERVVKAPALSGLLQRLLFTGTKRARRKAASLARVFQRRESAYGVAGGGTGTGEASVVMPISVQVS